MTENGGAPLPDVYVHRDDFLHRVRLSQLLRETGYSVATPAPGTTLPAALSKAPGPPGLLILPVDSSYALLVDLEGIRDARPAFAKTPILGMTLLDRSDLDGTVLRDLGVVALADKSTPAERVRFYVDRILRARDSGRRHERVPCCLPTDVEVGGRSETEWIENLSESGAQLACGRRLIVDDDVHLTFRPLTEDEGFLTLRARVVYAEPNASEHAPFRVGVVFRDLDARTRGAVAGAVDRLSRSAALCVPGDEALS